MNTVFVRALMLAFVFPCAAWAGDAKEDPPAKAAAKKAMPGAHASLHTNMAWQIALDAARFSPGILDGKWGRKGEMAAIEYAASIGANLNSDEGLNKVLASLHVDADHPTATYTVGAADLAEVGPLSEDWNERAKLDRLHYPTMQEALAEKFHCTQALLNRINPGVHLNGLKAGDSLTVPNLRPFPAPGALPPAKAQGADRLKINVVEKTIRAFDANGRQLALFHCSVAKDKEKLPARDAKIVTMASPPNYTFDPKGWPEVTNVDRKLTIAPGPRNPVGLAWIGLDLPGYGIHGNPKPELIGKTGSHGCFRMTNWDALALFAMAKVGMTVEITGAEPKATAPKAPAIPDSHPKEAPK